MNFKSAHNLPFEACPWHRDAKFTAFRIGTINGIYHCSGKSYTITAIINDKPGNDHMVDFFQWFSHACRRDGYTLRFEAFFNQSFKHHLMKRHGFIDISAQVGIDCVEKTYVSSQSIKK